MGIRVKRNKRLLFIHNGRSVIDSREEKKIIPNEISGRKHEWRVECGNGIGVDGKCGPVAFARSLLVMFSSSLRGPICNDGDTCPNRRKCPETTTKRRRSNTTTTTTSSSSSSSNTSVVYLVLPSFTCSSGGSFKTWCEKRFYRVCVPGFPVLIMDRPLNRPWKWRTA